MKFVICKSNDTLATAKLMFLSSMVVLKCMNFQLSWLGYLWFK